MRILQSALFAFGIFVGALLCQRAGWQLGRRWIKSGGDDANAGLGAVEGAIFGLMGLLLALTLTGAVSRFDGRRDLVVDEVNAIGTAWVRLDLFQPDARSELRGLFRRYLDMRIAIYERIDDDAALGMAMRQAEAAQQALWARLMTAVRVDTSLPLVQSILPPVNSMFDIAQARLLATRQHPPLAIYLMLGFVALVSALLAGFGMAKAKSQSMLHLVSFAAIVSSSIYLILDIEFPYLGLVRVDYFDQALVSLRATMD